MTTLKDTYLKAYYYIIELDTSIIADELNHQLDNYLQKNNHTSWAIITAYNPKSIVLCEQENKSNNENLKNDLKNYKFLNTKSGSNSSDWGIEYGFIIFNITKERSLKIAKKYNQNAILFGEQHKKAELIFI